MSFKLSIEQGKGRGQTFDFDAASITIGRAEENDIVLYEEQGVSRRHARIAQAEGKYTIEDMESANGTLLNGARMKKETLAEGDTIGIGSVVFRFGGAKAAGKSEDGSTRIVSLTKDSPRTNPKAEMPLKPSGGSNAGTPNPLMTTTAIPAAANTRNVRMVVGAVGIATLVAVLFVVVQNRARPANSKGDCDTIMDYSDGAKLLAFGNNAEAVCAATTRVQFGFVPKAKQKVILSYLPFYTEGGEVQVLLNKQRVEDVPLAPTHAAKRHEVVLPESLLQADKPNVLSFVSDKGGEWGVARIDLMMISPQEADAKAGEEAYNRGRRLYDQRHVAAPNLYNAWQELKKARRLMEGVEPKPADYRPALELIANAEQELNVTCDKELFGALHEQKYAHYDYANQHYKYIDAAFPGDEHPCRYQAHQRIPSLVQQQQRAAGGG